MPLTDAEYRHMCLGISDYHNRDFHEHAAEDMAGLIADLHETNDLLEGAQKELEDAEKASDKAIADAVEDAEKPLKEQIEDLRDEATTQEEENEKEAAANAALLTKAEGDLTRFEEGARIVLVALCSRPMLQPEINASPEPIMALLFVQAVGVLIEIVAFTRDENARMEARREELRKEHVVRFAREPKTRLIERVTAAGVPIQHPNGADGHTKQQLAEILAAWWTDLSRAAGGLAHWSGRGEDPRISKGFWG